MFTEEELAIQRLAEQALVATHLFHSAIKVLESNGWKQSSNSTTPYYWWFNAELNTGSCAISVALQYQHQREAKELLAHVLTCSGTPSDCEDCKQAQSLVSPDEA